MHSCSSLPSLEFELVVAAAFDVFVAGVADAGAVYSPFHGLPILFPHPRSDEVSWWQH